MEVVTGKQKKTKSDLLKQFGANVKKFREEKQLNQEDLAVKIGKEYASYIGRIEIGQKFPRPENIAKLAEVFGIPIYQLFLFEDDLAEKDRPLMELVDYLKNRPANDARFLLSVCREHVKEYSSKSHKH